MPTFEEKILAYLDGSLGGDERDEVLRDVSDSPERRALLDAHVRLQKFYTQAAKPVSAPLALQRELASQIPVLAIKLPYLAPEQKRRKGAIAGFWSDTTDWLGAIKTTWINSILVILVALLAGGLWYLARNSAHSDTTVSSSGNSTNNLTSSTGNSSQSNTPSSNTPSSNTPNNASPNNPNSVGSSAIVGDTNQTKTHSVKKSIASAQPSPAVANLHRAIEERGYSASSIAAKHPESAAPVSNAAPTENAAHKDIAKADRNTNANSNQAQQLDIKPNKTQQTELKPAAPTAIPDKSQQSNEANKTAIVTDTTPTKHEQVAENAKPATPLVAEAKSNASNAAPIPVDKGEETPHHTTVFVQNVFRSRLGQGNPTSYALTVLPPKFTALNFEAGVDYEISPSISAGVIAGDYQFVQWRETYHLSSKGYLDRYSHDYKLDSVATPLVGLDVKYTIDPDGDVVFAIRGGAGLAFIPNQSMALVGLGELSAAHDVATHFALVGAVHFDAAALGLSTAKPTAPPGNTIGILNEGNPSTGPQTAIGISLGISYHP